MALLDRRSRRSYANTAFIIFCTVAAGIAISALAAILISLLVQGVGGVDLDVFTKETPGAGGHGGLANAIIGSIELCFVAMVGAVFIGLFAGTWLAEYGGNSPYANTIRFLNDVLLSAPSILIGLFVYEIAVAPMHGFSGLAGAAALALIAAPVITRTTEDVLKLQAKQLRESGVALGAPFWITVRSILWRAATGGILTGALLAFARISGETAPLLFTSFGNQFTEISMLKPIASLPQAIFQFALSADDNWKRLAWVGSLLISFAVLTINIIVRVLSTGQKR
jgi:phosphate transport system permease protein